MNKPPPRTVGREYLCVSCGAAYVLAHSRQSHCTKECQRIHNNATRGARMSPEERESGKERVRRWREENIERAKAAGTRWVRMNPEKRRAIAKRAQEKAHANTPWRPALYQAKQRAKEKGLPFDLTAEWCVSRWTGRCEMSGIEFVRNTAHGPHTYSASIDKIDHTKGYTQGNCRFILHGINAMKGTATDAEIVVIMKAIVSNYKLPIVSVLERVATETIDPCA